LYLVLFAITVVADTGTCAKRQCSFDLFVDDYSHEITEPADTAEVQLENAAAGDSEQPEPVVSDPVDGTPTDHLVTGDVQQYLSEPADTAEVQLDNAAAGDSEQPEPLVSDPVDGTPTDHLVTGDVQQYLSEPADAAEVQLDNAAAGDSEQPEPLVSDPIDGTPTDHLVTGDVNRSAPADIPEVQLELEVDVISSDRETTEVSESDNAGEGCSQGRPSRGRKRKYEYSDAERKRRRNSNMVYTTRSGEKVECRTFVQYDCYCRKNVLPKLQLRKGNVHLICFGKWEITVHKMPSLLEVWRVLQRKGREEGLMSDRIPESTVCVTKMSVASCSRRL